MTPQFYKKNTWVTAKNILIVIIILHAVNNIYWFKKDGYVYPGSHAVWLEQKSFGFAEFLLYKKIPIVQKAISAVGFFNLRHYYYAFSVTNFNLTAFFIALPMCAPVNGHMKLFLINSVLFLQFLSVILIIYYLGKIMFNKRIGAWSGIIFSFYPGAVGLSRKVNSELMVTFFIILTVIIFIQEKRLCTIIRLFLLFIVFALGTLSGGLFLVFFIPLLLLKICYDFLFHEKKIEILTYLILFLCLIFLFFNFYFNGEYLKVFLSLKEGLRECYHKLFFKSAGNFIGSAANGLLGIFLFAPQGSFCACTQTTNVGINIKTFLFYIIEAVYYISPLFFLLAIWSFLFLLKDKKINFYKRSLFAVWVFIGYLLLSLFHIKWGKFITPILPVFALSSGVFISDYVKRPRVKKAVILLLGISTVFYYSYLSKAYIHCFETIGEGIISHAPVKSKFLYTAEQVAARINDYNTGKTDELITIGFLDKESARFQGAWFSDSSMKVSNLTKTFLTKGFRMTDFWSLSDDFYHSLHKQDFVILITKKKIKKIEDYLFPEEPKKIPNLKFDIIYEDWLKEDVFIYLLKVSKI